MARLNKLLGKLPKKFHWSLHNLVAHPLSEIVYLIGCENLSNTIHDATIPEHLPGTGRG